MYYLFCLHALTKYYFDRYFLLIFFFFFFWGGGGGNKYLKGWKKAGHTSFCQPDSALKNIRDGQPLSCVKISTSEPVMEPRT